MTLVNFKKIKIRQEDILRVLMALIFLSAGVFRIFNPELARNELQALNVPQMITWLIVTLEIIGGVCLLCKIKHWKVVVYIFLVFLVIALGLALKTNLSDILNNASELFVFNSNPTDVFLHFVFVLILLSFIFKKHK